MVKRQKCMGTLGCMMTSSNGNIFRFTGPVCKKFTGHRWIPLRKASDAELWYYFQLCLNTYLSTFDEYLGYVLLQKFVANSALCTYHFNDGIQYIYIYIGKMSIFQGQRLWWGVMVTSMPFIWLSVFKLAPMLQLCIMALNTLRSRQDDRHNADILKWVL